MVPSLRACGQVEQGAINTYDVKVAAGEASPAKLPLLNYSPATFHPHGIYLQTQPSGEKLMFVVNHRGDGEAVSIFSVSDAGASFIGDVKHPLFRTINDVVAVGKRIAAFPNTLVVKG